MKNIIELKVKLINQYLNKDYKMFDTTVQGQKSQKVEYIYFDYLIMKGIEYSIGLYEPLLLIGTSKEVKEYISKMKDTLKRYFEYKIREVTITEFINDYNIDINDINCECLKIVTYNLQNNT